MNEFDILRQQMKFLEEQNMKLVETLASIHLMKPQQIIIEFPIETAEQLAEKFHNLYEELAPSFGYETRKESAKPWANVPEKNKALMIEVCRRILMTWHK